MTDRPTQLGKDVAHAMNLLAHPLGGVAAASAVTLGVATQAWGMWFGAVAGAMESAQRLAGEAAPAKIADAETVAAVKARAAAVSLMADAQSLAREMAETAPRKASAKAARPSAKPAARAPAAAKADAAMAKPAAGQKPARPDDLKAISGIGPKLEQVLNGMGVWTYAQIAAWTPAEMAWVDDQLGFGGRILRDDWLGQAGRLAAASR